MGSVVVIQRTRSSKSQRSTRRCVAGKVGSGGGRRGGGAAGGGGKPRRSGGLVVEAPGGQEAVGQHDQREVAVQPVPAATLVVVEAALPLGVLVEPLDRPAGMRQRDESVQRRVQGSVG